MGGVQRVGNVDGHGEQKIVSIGLPAMRCFRVNPSRYSIAMKTVLLLADFVNRADVGVVQCGRCSGLALKAFQR